MAAAAFVLLPGFIAMAAMFALFGNILIKILDIFTGLFPIIPLLFDPPRLANEIITGVTVGLVMIIQKVSDFFNPNILTSKDSMIRGDMNNQQEDCKNKICYRTNIINLLFLIICPPFAIFQAHGFVFHEIFLCTLLTVYGYYFPGLIYAIITTGLLSKR